MLKARHKDLHPLLKAAEWLLIMVVCMAAVFALWQVLPVNHASTGALLLFQALQAIGLFIVPPFVVAYLWSDWPLEWLHIVDSRKSKDRAVGVAEYRYNAHSLAADQPAGELERADTSAGESERTRATDATDGSTSRPAAAELPHLSEWRMVGAAAESACAGCSARHRRRTDVPRRAAATAGQSKVESRKSRACGSLGDGFHLLVHTFSVLRLHTAAAVRSATGLRVAVERKHPLQHDHARHEQCPVGAAVLSRHVYMGYVAGADRRTRHRAHMVAHAGMHTADAGAGVCLPKRCLKKQTPILYFLAPRLSIAKYSGVVTP